jgi:hypothetical protein
MLVWRQLSLLLTTFDREGNVGICRAYARRMGGRMAENEEINEKEKESTPILVITGKHIYLCISPKYRHIFI